MRQPISAFDINIVKNDLLNDRSFIEALILSYISQKREEHYEKSVFSRYILIEKVGCIHEAHRQDDIRTVVDNLLYNTNI